MPPALVSDAAQLMMTRTCGPGPASIAARMITVIVLPHNKQTYDNNTFLSYDKVVRMRMMKTSTKCVLAETKIGVSGSFADDRTSALASSRTSTCAGIAGYIAVPRKGEYK
jgi:hypothetical protein